MKRLRKAIGKIWKRGGHWRANVWGWMKKRSPRAELQRARAYRDWGRHHWHEAKRQGKAKNVVHGYWVVWHAAKRHAKWRAKHLPEPKPDPAPASGFVIFDGRQVAAWMVSDALAPARASGVWRGVVFSGYRTPEYSRSLCEAMCGAPTCPGRCAGEFSNHACPPSHTGVRYEGAVDVTDPGGLQAWCANHGYPIRHTLPYDAPHFSHTGQ